jgi:midasin (ATPase involved in ribosome maturation)
MSKVTKKSEALEILDLAASAETAPTTKVRKPMSEEAKAKISESLRKRKSVVTEAVAAIDESSRLVANASKIKTSGNTVTLNDYFKIEKGTFEIVKHNIEYGVNTMLIGATGTGKTEVIANIAKVFDLPLTIFDMGTMTDPVMGLVGTHVITVENGVTKSEFKRSRFSEVIQQPGIVLLDEISRAGAMANNLLFPCLDFRRELPMEYSFHDTTPVKIHPQCVFFSTANMGSQYTGTHKLDRALLDRFMLIEMDSIKKEDIAATLQSEFPRVEKTKIDKLVNVFEKINKEHDEFKISFNLSLRHLKTITKLVSNGFTIYDGFVVLCKGLGSQEGLKSIKAILDDAK